MILSFSLGKSKNSQQSYLNLVNPDKKLDFNYHFKHKSELRLVPNLLENCNHNPNLVWINKIQKRFFRV